MAGRTGGAAAGLPVFVACDDDDVARWADGAWRGVLGARAGLNGAVDAGRATVAGKGFDHVVIAHSDLPLARTLRPGHCRHHLARPRSPPRRDERDEPAVAAVDTASYGGGSFTRHLDQAMATGQRVEVRVDPRLAIDVDNPDDLRHPTVEPILPPWLRTILANPA